MAAAMTRRGLLAGAGAGAASAILLSAARADDRTIRLALTPVLVTADLTLLDHIQAYLEAASGRPVQLVTRRTYQEITAMAVAGQVDAAWVCGFPFVEQESRLSLVAVPIWKGKPLYQSYLICDADRQASSIDDLRGDIHAFSDPDSNSGYLVTAAELARQRLTPDRFFRQSFFTYGHYNVVRAVAAGLAQSGSVDGYVYEVLRETDADLVAKTRVVRASDWFGFPPIACQAGLENSERTQALAAALLGMHKRPDGQAVLKELRLDSFAVEPPSLFASIRENWNLVRSLA